MVLQCSGQALKQGSERAVRHVAAVTFGVAATRVMLSNVFQWDGLGNHISVALGDPNLCASTLDTVLRACLGNFGLFIHAGMFFPISWALALTDHLLGVEPLYVAIRIFTSNVVLAFNLVLILSTTLCFLSMYAYLFSRLSNGLAAVFGGCVFAFASSRLAQFGHMQLVVLFYMPVAVLALEKSLESGQRLWRVLFVALSSLQFLAAYYLGYPFLVYICVHGAVVCFCGAARAPRARRLVIDLLAVGLIVSAFSWPYLLVQHWYAHRGDLAVIARNSATLSSYLSTPGQNDEWGRILSVFQAAQMGHEKWLFPGATVYILALCSISLPAVGKQHRTVATIAWVCGAVALFVLSFGPFLMARGTKPAIPLPYLLLYYIVPGFGSMSVPARIGLTWLFPVACMSAYAADAVMRSLRRKELATWAALFGCIAIGVFLFESRMRYEQFLFPTTGTVPAVYAWLSTQPVQGGVRPVGAAWLNPTGRDGVMGRATYTRVDGKPLAADDAWLHGVKNQNGVLKEPLKLLPIAALDGDVVYPRTLVDATGLAKEAGASGLSVRWEIDPKYGQSNPLTFWIRPAAQFTRQFRKDRLSRDISVTASDNNEDVGAMLDGELSTRATTKRINHSRYVCGDRMPRTDLTSLPLARWQLYGLSDRVPRLRTVAQGCVSRCSVSFWDYWVAGQAAGEPLGHSVRRSCDEPRPN